MGGFTEMPQEASFDAMVRLQQKAAAVIGADPNVEAYFSLVNAQGGNQGSGNAGRLQLRLKPRAQRKLTPEQIIEELRPKLNQIPGVRTYLQNPPLIRVGGQQTRTVYQYTLQAQDLDELYHAAGVFEKRMKEVPGLFDVNSDLQIASPEVVLDIDRDHASSLNVTADQIEDALYDAFGERQVSDIYTPTNDYWVVMELLPRTSWVPAALQLPYIRSATGNLVPLDAVTKPRITVGPLSVTHLGQLPSVTLSFNLAPGVSLGDAVDRIERAARDTLPADIQHIVPRRGRGVPIVSAGHGTAARDGAFLVIYMVLGILYESFIHPLTILSGLPSAGLGALPRC